MRTLIRRFIPILALLLWTASPDAQRSAQQNSDQTRVTAPPTRRAASNRPRLTREVRGRAMPGAPIAGTVTPTMFEQQPDQPPGLRHEPREQRLQRGGSFEGDLRSLTETRPVRRRERPEREKPRPTPVPLIPSEPVPPGIDPVVPPSVPAPPPLTSFAGLDRANWGAGHPPDANGDVGPTYYIQSINTSIGIYEKATGIRVAAFTFDTFMSQGAFGNLCDTENFGDPIVLYDTFEDRWVISDFAFRLDGSGNVITPPGAFQCFAVSRTGDPVSGGWNFYSISVTGGLGDYPKLGVWPDGIYMSVNMFGFAATGGFQNVRVYALNKAQMYAGAPSVQVVEFNLPATEFGLLPANARLQTGAPPPGSPNYFTSVWRFLNVVGVWKFHADWNNVAASTLTGPFNSITATNWSQLVDTTVQPPGGNQLDTLYPRLMMQNQYTNIGGVESLWNSHTVGGTPDFSNQAAVRYYQVKVTGGTVEANATQASTYSPDGITHRFIPSVAVDSAGNMAIGYSATSHLLYPSIRYAGRLAADPPNTITQTETTLMDGAGNQNGFCGGSPCGRWGDYSAMTLDPDGCTFWYTNQYYQVHGVDYQTRIGSFSFPSCIAGGGQGTLQGTVTNALSVPIAGATITLGSRVTTTDAAGNYSFDLPAGNYPGATVSFPGYVTATSSAITISGGVTTTRDFVLTAAPVSGCLTDTTQADFQAGSATNCDLAGSAGDVRLARFSGLDQYQATLSPGGEGFNATFWAGQTFRAGITGALTRVDVDLFCSACAGTPPNITVSIRATSSGSPTGPDLAVATIPGFTDPAGGFFPAVFATPASVTAGTIYAVVIRPVANLSAGTYAYGLSTANLYPPGRLVVSGNSGATWSGDILGRDLGFITYVDSGFAPSGAFESSLKDANPAAGVTAAWGALSWNASVPAGTTLQFQAAASNDSSGPFTFVGPDGTPATFFASGASLAQFNGNRYLKYRATLTTSDGSVTPAIHDVTVCFNNDAPPPPPTPTTASLSPNAVTFAGKQLVGTTSAAAPPVSFTNNGPGTVTFTSFNGNAPAASFMVGTDFPATTNCPLPPAALASGGSCQFTFSFSPVAAGTRNATLTIATDASNSPHAVALGGSGFVVDDATVTATMAAAAARLQQLQNGDGGWYFAATATDCGGNAFQGGSCNNIVGVTGLGLVSAYERTGDASMLADAVQAGQLLQAIHTANPAQPPFSQDLEFLRALSLASADPQYAALASAWFSVVTTNHPIAADRVDWQFANRGMLAVWDIASLIRSAKAANRGDYAQALGNRVIALEPSWRGVDANLTLIGMGSLLWAIHDLPGFTATIADYRSWLLTQQAPAGTWSDGNLQTTAYVALGLGAVGGDTAAAIQRAVEYFIANQLTNGGWPFSIVNGVAGDEFSPVDSEVARAIDLLFSTGLGSSVTVAPAQLAAVTFGAVSVAGTTSIVATATPQGAKPLKNYTLVNGLTYQATTTATVGGSTVMCVSVPWNAVAGRFNDVRLVQVRSGRWTDVTLLSGAFAPDAAAQRVCGDVSLLSPVAVALRGRN